MDGIERGAFPSEGNERGAFRVLHARHGGPGRDRLPAV